LSDMVFIFLLIVWVFMWMFEWYGIYFPTDCVDYLGGCLSDMVFIFLLIVWVFMKKNALQLDQVSKKVFKLLRIKILKKNTLLIKCFYKFRITV
jgi:hypothetical protein